MKKKKKKKILECRREETEEKQLKKRGRGGEIKEKTGEGRGSIGNPGSEIIQKWKVRGS